MTKMKCRQCEHFEECRSENIIIDATTSDDNWQNPFDHVYIFGLIDEVPSYCHYEKESLDCINMVIIKDAKMNQKEFYPNAWIPCSERLPEEEGEYLVTVYCTENIIWVDKFEYFTTSDGWVDPSNVIDWNGYVVAWMPLPQPWKEVEDEHTDSN